MLSGNPNRLYLPATPHPPIWLFPQKNHNKFVRHDLALGTHAENGLLI